LFPATEKLGHGNFEASLLGVEEPLKLERIGVRHASA
jgi:hypothetical protein